MSGRQLQRGPIAAFTLVELMVVLVLVAILTALILPEMRGTYADAQLRSSGRQLADALHLASSRAVSLSQIHRIRLDQETGHFALERRQRHPGMRTAFDPVRDLAGSEGTLASGLTFNIRMAESSLTESIAPPRDAAADNSDSTPCVTFYPDGTADPAEISLRHDSGFGLLLRVQPSTARVQIETLGPK